MVSWLMCHSRRTIVIKMRFPYFIVTIVLISASVFGKDDLPKNKLEENVLTLLRKWRMGDRGPFQVPLPSLDVVTTPTTSGRYGGYGVRVSYSTSPLKLVGLKDFTVEKIDISGKNLKASGVLAVPMLSITADQYQIKGTVLSFFSTQGSGNMTIVLGNIQINFVLRLKNNKSRMWVDTLQLSYTVANAKAILQGGPSSVAVLLNNYGTSILRSNHDAIVTYAQDFLKRAIDSFISILTPEQLYTMIEDPAKQPPKIVAV